jgi:hypothetical protein
VIKFQSELKYISELPRKAQPLQTARKYEQPLQATGPSKSNPKICQEYNTKSNSHCQHAHSDRKPCKYTCLIIKSLGGDQPRLESPATTFSCHKTPSFIATCVSFVFQSMALNPQLSIRGVLNTRVVGTWRIGIEYAYFEHVQANGDVHMYGGAFQT